MTTTKSDAETGLLLISTARPTRSDRRLALAVVVALVIALAIAAPFTSVRLPRTEALVPAYLTAVCICQLVTAAMLFGLYNVQRTRSMLVLAAGYLGVALMVVPWALSFPGAFPAFGLDERLQATASLAAVNRIGFPLIVLLSALISAVPKFDHANSGAAAIAVTVGVVSTGVAVFSAAVPVFGHAAAPVHAGPRNSDPALAPGAAHGIRPVSRRDRRADEAPA